MEEAAIFVENESDTTIEWIASQMARRTEGSNKTSDGALSSHWSVIEVWRSMGRVAVSDSSTTRIELTVTAANVSSHQCYKIMRSPRGHACSRCMSNKTAAMMRHAVETVFTPGIALVGRSWLRGRSEMVDIPTSELSTYARAEMAANAGLSTAISVPVVCQQSVTAVVIVYFETRLDTPTALSTLAAMTDVNATYLAAYSPGGTNASSPPATEDGSEDRLSLSSSTIATESFPRSIEIPFHSVSLSPDQRDQRLAEKLGCSQDDSIANARTPAAVHPCPVCFDTIECAVKITACAHAACAECLARWSILSKFCPACGGFVDTVVRDLKLDKKIMRDLRKHREHNHQMPILDDLDLHHQKHESRERVDDDGGESHQLL